MSRGKLLAVVGVILTLGFIAGFIIVQKQSDPSSDQQEAPIFVTKVGVSGLDKVLPKISPISEESVQAALKGIIRRNINDPKENYSADFREGSFTASVKPSGAPLKRFIVDIPELERSFVIEITGSPRYGSTTLYALCPTPKELVYKPQACKDTP